MTARRVGERGLSLIEAIVVVTITALLALLILPILPRAASGSTNVAERGINALDQMRAEREFRALIRAVSPREIDGERQALIQGASASVQIQPTLPTQTGCARSGAPLVRLSVEPNALVCISDRRRIVLLRWPSDRTGALSYSANGAVWRADWTEAAAPFVRFELRRGTRIETTWAEHAVGGAP
ncbi:MAG: hypothetical protein ABL932_06005 [Terricaulis sp.]